MIRSPAKVTGCHAIVKLASLSLTGRADCGRRIATSSTCHQALAEPRRRAGRGDSARSSRSPGPAQCARSRRSCSLTACLSAGSWTDQATSRNSAKIRSSTSGSPLPYRRGWLTADSKRSARSDRFSTPRTVSSSSRRTRSRRSRPASSQSRSDMWPIAWTAVVGSLIPGDSAFVATSVSCCRPNATSSTSVRSKPT